MDNPLPNSYSKNKYLKTKEKKVCMTGYLLSITSSSGSKLAMGNPNLRCKILFCATLPDPPEILFSHG